MKLRSSLKKEIHTLLQPLLINIFEEDIVTVQIYTETLLAMVESDQMVIIKKKVKNTGHEEMTDVTIKYLVKMQKWEQLGILMSQTLDLLQNPHPSVGMS